MFGGSEEEKNREDADPKQTCSVAQILLVFSWSMWNSSAELPWSAIGCANAGGVVVVGGGERKEVRGLRGGGGRALSAHLHLLVAEV